jgi:hypothetical protein
MDRLHLRRACREIRLGTDRRPSTRRRARLRSQVPARDKDTSGLRPSPWLVRGRSGEYVATRGRDGHPRWARSGGVVGSSGCQCSGGEAGKARLDQPSSPGQGGSSPRGYGVDGVWFRPPATRRWNDSCRTTPSACSSTTACTPPNARPGNYRWRSLMLGPVQWSSPTTHTRCPFWKAWQPSGAGPISSFASVQRITGTPARA